MDNTKPSYSLCFKGCKEQANQTELRKIAIIISNVEFHDIGETSVYISFTDSISCQMAKDILGNDWLSIPESETEIYGKIVENVGYKIQNHYFTTLSKLEEGLLISK